MEKIIKGKNGQWSLVKSAPENTDNGKQDEITKAALDTTNTNSMKKAEEDEGKQKRDDFGVKVASGFSPKGKLPSASRKEDAQSVVPAGIKQGKAAQPKGGQKMSASYSEKINQLYDEGNAPNKKQGKLAQNISDANKILNQVKIKDAKTRTEEDKFKKLRDQAKRTVSAAKNAKYFKKPEKQEEVKVIRRKKEDVAKSLEFLENKLKEFKEELEKSLHSSDLSFNDHGQWSLSKKEEDDDTMTIDYKSGTPQIKGKMWNTSSIKDKKSSSWSPKEDDRRARIDQAVRNKKVIPDIKY